MAQVHRRKTYIQTNVFIGSGVTNMCTTPMTMDRADSLNIPDAVLQRRLKC